MVLGGLTAPLVSWLKIPNEIDGTLDVDKIMELFNEEETEYLLAIDEGFAKWEAYLLIHGRDNAHNHSDATAQGRADKAWHLASMAKAAAIDARHRVAKAQVRCLPSSNPVHNIMESTLVMALSDQIFCLTFCTTVAAGSIGRSRRGARSSVACLSESVARAPS